MATRSLVNLARLATVVAALSGCTTPQEEGDVAVAPSALEHPYPYLRACYEPTIECTNFVQFLPKRGHLDAWLVIRPCDFNGPDGELACIATPFIDSITVGNDTVAPRDETRSRQKVYTMKTRLEPGEKEVSIRLASSKTPRTEAKSVTITIPLFDGLTFGGPTWP